MGYKNFSVALFCTVNDLILIEQQNYLEDKISFIEKHVSFNKVYLETYRSGKLIGKEKLLKIKEFFNKRGVLTSGAITPLPTYDPELAFESFCYNNHNHMEVFLDSVKFTAGIFDEIILDDFFFTNCKCSKCIAAKKEQDWQSYRTERLKQVSEEIVSAAKGVNPNVNFIIKYPNWYEDYQNTGYNLEAQPDIFDMVYTGTETRDPENTQQHLQRYLSYFLMRYIENVKPGKNGGGWIDGLDCTYNLGAYGEQAYLTLFSKAKEITLFCFSLLASEHSVFVPLAGYVFDRADGFIGLLGKPQGIHCYKPYHSSGENYLHNYIGMLGVPMEPSPHFSSDSSIIFLTSSAAKDKDIISKIKERLSVGKNVFVTSGFLRSTQRMGIEDIACFNYTEKKASIKKFAYKTWDCAFERYYTAHEEIVIPQIEYGTNDVWTIISGISQNNNFPVLAAAGYGKGTMYILTIPDDAADLYYFPREILKAVRDCICEGMFVSIDAESKVGLFVYDNDTFIVQSFLPYNTTVNIMVDRCPTKLQELDNKYEYTGSSNFENAAGRTIEGTDVNGKTSFSIKLKARTFKVFKCV